MQPRGGVSLSGDGTQIYFVTHLGTRSQGGVAIHLRNLQAPIRPQQSDERPGRVISIRFGPGPR